MTRSLELPNPSPTDTPTDAWSVTSYARLRRLAARLLARERRDHTLQPTALAHEAYLRLREARSPTDGGREQFVRLAAVTMRRILVNHERDRRRQKRGGLARQEPLTEGFAMSDHDQVDLLALDEALERLASLDRRKADVVQLRFFAGLDLKDVAAALGISLAQVKRDWTFARAWLARALDREDP